MNNAKQIFFMSEFTLIPTRDLHRIMSVIARIEPLLTTQKGDWITPEQARGLLNCSDQTLRRLRAKGEIRYRTLGGQKGIMYSQKSLDKYQEQNSNK